MSNIVIGRPLSKEVSDQILKRQEKVGSLNRDLNTLYFMNSNKAWVKLTSGANTVSIEEMDRMEEETPLGDSTLARNNVLGGAQKKSGIEDGTNTNPLYRSTDSRGYRPAPGITSVSVKSKGTYGTLRETEVNFVVWSLEDLDTMETLYLRPGFSMLLEWGHTAYFTTQGEFRNSTNTISGFFSKYTSQTNESTQAIVQNKIDELRKESNYNYDAIFGYVKNFSWSLRQDGGYDCSISIASVGSLIEGLRADVGVQNIDAEDLERNESQQDVDSYKSPFHYIFSYLNMTPTFDYTNSTVDYYKKENRFVTKNISNFFKKVNVLDTTRVYSKKTTNISFYGLPLFSRNSFWFPLSLVFDIINTFITLKTDTGKTIELYSGVRDLTQTGPYEIESKYTTSDYHFSLNPYRVQLPKQHIIPSEVQRIDESIKKYLGNIQIDEKIGFGLTTENLGFTGLAAQNKIVTSFASTLENARGSSDDILNILVGAEVLLELFDRNLSEPNSQNRDLKSILDGLCTVLNDELGGVNEFDFHYDEKRNLFILVDRKNTPYEKQGIEYPRITLTGLKSTVESISLNSKLSNKVATQIAIAAQGSSNNYQENVSDILKWNYGVIDRHAVGGTYDQTDANTADSYSEEKLRREKWLKTASEIYRTNGEGDSYDSNRFTELKPYHRIYMSSHVLDQLVSIGQPQKGIIPIELTFTMLGISGIDIAEAFKISPGVLPTKYSDAFGFIITGLEHNIENKWTTTVKTQFYILQEPTEAEKSRASGFIGSNESSEEETPTVNTTVTTPNADRLRLALKSLNYLEKENEISSGGDIQEIAAKMGEVVFKRLKKVLPESTTLVVTSGNDTYHQKNSKTSRHIRGIGLDFVVAPNNSANLKLVEKELNFFVLANDPNFRYLNEYEVKTQAGTGGHFHISWGQGVESSSILEKVREDLAAYRYTLSPEYKIV